MKRTVFKKPNRKVQFQMDDEKEKPKEEKKVDFPPLTMHRSNNFTFKAKRANTIELDKLKFGGSRKPTSSAR